MGEAQGHTLLHPRQHLLRRACPANSSRISSGNASVSPFTNASNCGLMVWLDGNQRQHGPQLLAQALDVRRNQHLNLQRLFDVVANRAPACRNPPATSPTAGAIPPSDRHGVPRIGMLHCRLNDLRPDFAHPNGRHLLLHRLRGAHCIVGEVVRTVQCDWRIRLPQCQGQDPTLRSSAQCDGCGLLRLSLHRRHTCRRPNTRGSCCQSPQNGSCARR